MGSFEIKEGWEQRIDYLVAEASIPEFEQDWVACKFELKNLKTALTARDQECKDLGKKLAKANETIEGLIKALRDKDKYIL